MNILGIDYGAKKIGIAIAEIETKIPRSLNPIIRNQKTKQHVYYKIKELILDNECKKIIIGIPFNTEYHTGNKIETEQSIKVKKFAKNLKKYLDKHKLNVNILLVDESFTTVQAFDNLKKLGFKKQKIKKNIDSESARILLKNYLDYNFPVIEIH